MTASPLSSRRLHAPLAVQLLALLLGGLVVAQLATLALTLLFPPEPPSQYKLEDVASILRGAPAPSLRGRPLVRSVGAEPPSLQSPGWFVSERSRRDLAAMLGASEDDVRLLFYAPLPFAGVGAPGPPPPPASASTASAAPARPGGGLLIKASLALPQQGGVAGGRTTGGGFPAGGPIGGPVGGGLPTGGPITLPGGRVGDGSGRNWPDGGVTPSPAQRGTAIPPATSRIPFPRAPLPGASIPSGPVDQPPIQTQRPPPTGSTPPGLPTPRPRGDGPPVNQIPGSPPVARRPMPIPVPVPFPTPVAVPDYPREPVDAPEPSPPVEEAKREAPPAPEPAPAETTVAAAPPALRAPADPVRARAAPQLQAPAVPQIDLGVLTPAPMLAEKGAAKGFPLAAPEARANGLFGLAPAPFVQGDFVAALRDGAGRWITVRPEPEPFPNSWQRRVLLWFAISFGLVAPVGYLFARRLARPLERFAVAAERLGRDPSGPVLELDGPAEIGRAARAFTGMQSRLKRFIEDRTAMVGAISHDLRTPLARMRFRVERAPPEIKTGVLNDIGQMEEMISSVLVFIRDASEPTVRERIDLRSIVECVVDDVALVGGDAILAPGDPVSVEVDPLGVQRVLVNLIDNALKYGGAASVRMFTEGDEAVAEIEDAGPGLPPEELERVFLPFYRSPAARNSSRAGMGLGLAVSRSIARAHGGDVRLSCRGRGTVAQLRLPLARAA